MRCRVLSQLQALTVVALLSNACCTPLTHTPAAPHSPTHPMTFLNKHSVKTMTDLNYKTGNILYM
jgi:hypothetical protein